MVSHAQPSPSEKPTTRRTLVEIVREKLRTQIESGRYPTGQRLPSEAQMTQEFEVSRTVIREAVASLRADGLVEPRQGAGVFVLEPTAQVKPPFQNIDLDRISSVIELLELRTAVEVEAAGLAATRRSPAQEEEIIRCMHDVQRAATAGTPTMEADFALHLTIARATNNPRFSEFLSMIGTNLIPRKALAETDAEPVAPEYLDVIQAEHEEIVNAILNGDEDAARTAMRSHLKSSQTRYRALLRAGNTRSA
ncbi:DNA-binding FadR family transcriptional regulator [Sagittula marina]|uniref:DNA-binding FadR family transcriptional regulator n=1 Tax=Sagittula marina TaxID=943940 RepID=A0A7W6DXZ9_9RHOB|nr:FadR/GntR family transcriptional regulator [Sagittula marina]MBB3988243.1 DNA-binding FadR family transcriptional regulator [Sagittula marina]